MSENPKTAADAALSGPLDLGRGDVQIVAEPRAKVVMSARVSAEHSRWVLDEAAAAGMRPSALIADLLAEAIAARQAAIQDGRRLVDVADVHRLLDTLARAAA